MATDQGVRRGFSAQIAASDAVDEIWNQTFQPDLKLAVLFCSSLYDIDRLAARIVERFGDANVVGCTTAGEIGPAGIATHTITAFSLAGQDFDVATGCIDSLASFSIPDGCETASRLLHELAAKGVEPSPQNTFAFQLIDGLSKREEAVSSAHYCSMNGIPLIGGSAADDGRFVNTLVYCRGEFRTDRVVLNLVSTRRKFKVFRTHHFVESGDRFVVTASDPANRIVMQINDESAAQEYASIIGMRVEDLGPDVFAANPVLISVHGMGYARAVARALEDGSLSFNAAIDEGTVMRVGKPKDIVEDLRRMFSDIRQKIGDPAVIVGFDCFYRRIEIARYGLEAVVSETLKNNNVVGFCTLGEQFGALHNAHTFAGVAISGDADSDD